MMPAPEPSTRKRELFLAALEQPPAGRAAFLDRECRGDPALRADVEALLSNHVEDSFLEQPAETIAADVPMVPAERPGDRIGRFKLLEKIGEGGCGVVYMAEQEQPVKRRVALKVIKLGMDTSSVIARFEAERQALAMMDHPNIAKVLDGGATDAGRPYFVMELVPGIRLTDYCDQNHLCTRERLDLFVKVCHAVQHAHQKGIIHRDLKPSNILVTLHDGVPVPKVIDFGIAKATGQRLTDKTLFTQLGAMLGTPAYMSPEQAELSGLDIDTRSDLYSLGVLLYQLLTGRPPFDPKELVAGGLEQMCRTIREQEPPTPSASLTTLAREDLATLAQRHRTDVPKLVKLVRGDLDWIVMKCLEKDRSRRYATASDLVSDIQRHLQSEPITARPPSAAYRFQKFFRRNKLSVLAATSVFAALIVGTALATWQASNAERQRVAAVGAQTQAEAARAQAKTAESDARIARDKAIAQKLRADEQAAIARTVNDFLRVDLLRQADSRAQADQGFVANPDLTVKEALRRAAQLIGERFKDSPLIEAEVRHAIGDAYTGIGEGKLAAPHLERARELSTTHRGANHTATLKIVVSLGNAYLAAGQFSKALPLFEEAWTRLKAVSGPDDKDTLDCLSNLAVVCERIGEIRRALPLHEEVLQRRIATAGTNDSDTLIAMHNLAICYQSSSQLDRSLPLFEQTYRLRLEKLGPSHPQTLSTLLNLASASRLAGHLEKALALSEEAHDRTEATFGPEHPITLVSSLNLALTLGGGQIDRARTLLDDALTKMRKKLGPNHPLTIEAMQHLGSIYLTERRLADALPLYEETLALAKTNLGAEHPLTLRTLSRLGYAYDCANQSAKAVSLLQEALAAQTTKFGSNHLDTLGSLDTLAGAYRHAGRYDEAVPLYLEVIAKLRTMLGVEHRLTLTALHNLGEVQSRRNNYAAASSLYREIVQVQRARYPAGHEDVVDPQASLGRSLTDWAWAERNDKSEIQNPNSEIVERAHEAERLLRECLAAREAETNLSRAVLGDTRSRLGAAVLAVAVTDSSLTKEARLGRFADAEEFLLSGLTLMQRSSSSLEKHKRDGLERLVRLYTAWDDSAPNTSYATHAAEWKQKLADFNQATAKTKPAGAEP